MFHAFSRSAVPLALIFGLAAVTALASGIGTARAGEPPKGGTLAKIAASKTIAIGFREDASPFSYRSAEGGFLGYSVDLCQRLVEKLRLGLGLDRLAVTQVPTTAATRFVLVRSGKIDLECATTTNTAERREQVAFSYPHFFTATRFVSRKRDGFDTIAALKGRTVASTTGSVNIEQLNAVNAARGLNISVTLAKLHSDAFQMVEEGRAAAFVTDAVLLAAIVAASPHPQDYVISQESFGPPEPYGLLMRKDDLPFQDAVNAGLREIFTGGEMEAIYRKWLQAPIPPSGFNLNLPMSAELKAAFAAPKPYP